MKFICMYIDTYEHIGIRQQTRPAGPEHADQMTVISSGTRYINIIVEIIKVNDIGYTIRIK